MDAITIVYSLTPFDYFKNEEHKERFYSNGLFNLIFGLGLNPIPEPHTSKGRADFVIHYEGVTWVLGIIVSETDKDDERKAAEAINQIKDRDHGGGYRDHVLLGIAVNHEARGIKAWKCEGKRQP
jgi:hypothetical protein